MVESFCIECFILNPPNQTDPWSILLQGPPKSGKSMFGKNFVKSAAHNGTVVYVTTDQLPEILQSDLPSIMGKPDAIKIIDCYSWRGGIKSNERYLQVSSANLSDLSIALNKVLSESVKPFLVLDSISGLAMDTDEESTLKCIRMLVARLKMTRITGLFTVSEGIHSSKFINALRTTFDGIIEMKVEDHPDGLVRLVRIFGVKGNAPVGGWTTFSLSRGGIAIGTVGYRLRTALRFILREFFLRRKDKFSVDELSKQAATLDV